MKKMMGESVTHSSGPRNCRRNFRVAIKNGADVSRSREKCAVKGKIFANSARDEEKVVVIFYLNEKSFSACKNVMNKCAVLKCIVKLLDAGSNIKVTSPERLKMKRVSNWLERKFGTNIVDEFVIVEEHLGKVFQTFVKDGVLKTNLYELSELVHLSYELSGGQYVIGGLKGALDGRIIRLSIPVIHSVTQRFGNSDAGMAGIETVFRNHTCTSKCRAWRRPVPVIQSIDDSDCSLGHSVNPNYLSFSGNVCEKCGHRMWGCDPPPPYSDTL